MSTRGVVGLRAQGRDWLMYNHSSSYPTELGLAVTKAVRNIDIEQARQYAKALIEVGEDDVPKTQHLEEIWPQLGETEDVRVEMARPIGKRRTFYALYGPIQGQLDAFISRGLRFWPHTLFALSQSCEWGYVLNLDEEVLEYYTGHWSATHDRFRPKLRPRGRFTKHPELEPEDHPLHLVEAVGVGDLRALPTWTLEQWLERLQRRY